MDLQDFKNYIDKDELPDISKRFEIRKIIDRYPFFQAGIFIYLKCLYLAEDKMFRPELQRLSIFVVDRQALFYYILSNEYKKFFEETGKKKEIGKSRTDILLNAFFETVDDETIDRQIEQTRIKASAVAYDYFSYLKSMGGDNQKINGEVSTGGMKHQSIIDDFISNASDNENIKFDLDRSKNFTAVPNKSEEELDKELQDDDLFFTETLANIYIKQQKYERACEIIKRLSLNYPEKNIYFASQISFLEKLIINKKHKK
ncbi:MAG: hypothetical protein ACLVKO_06705 [Dysgonomonas sp.]